MSKTVDNAPHPNAPVPTLVELRERAGLTTRQVADQIGRSQPRITQIEHEGTQSVDILTLLAETYRVPLSDVLAANATVRNR